MLRARLVVLNHNGGTMTLTCLERLRPTKVDGVDVSIVLVDNASDDGVADEVERQWPDVEVRRNAVNLGFSGGCNSALRDLEGIDLVGLVNNDLLVESGWLVPLVAALADAPAVGAASPKMLFADRFQEVSLAVEAPRACGGAGRVAGGVRVGAARLDKAGPDVNVQRVDGFFGPERAGGELFEWTGADALLRLPVAFGAPVPDRWWLRLGADRPTAVTVRSGAAHDVVRVTPGADWYEIRTAADPADVVNNVGSLRRADGYGVDRGYLEVDRGQYDLGGEIEAWCGGAVLLRADYLRDVGIFDERLFLYYEDLELSLRGRLRGWRYRYSPESVVRHHHAATAVEGSPVSRFYNERNRLLVCARHSSATALAGAVARYLLSTASYARRDVFVPLLHGRRPHLDHVAVRLRALGAFLVGAPGQMRSRRRDRRRATAA